MSAAGPPWSDGTGPRVRGRRRGALLLVLAVGLAGALVAGGTVLPDPVEQTVEMAVGSVDEARSGTAYCPVTASDGDSAVLEIVSTSADQDSQITITRFVDGVPQIDEPRVLAAGRSSTLEIPSDQLQTPVAIDWLGAPVVAQYRLTDATEEAAAPCQNRPSDRWFLTGFDTNRGNTSTIHLFNPFESDAIVTLRFGTTEGPVDLIIADELSVPAGEVVVRDLAEFRPETGDLAVTVESQTGRVVPQGEIRRGPAGEGLEAVTGRALVPAVPEASEELFIAEALVDSATDSWVTVYNPEDRAAAVQISITTPLATAASALGEVTVPAGGTTRFELADQSALPRMGVTLTSVNGVPLVASRTSALRAGERAGVSVSGASGAADAMWTVAGARPPDGIVVILNPGAAVVTAQAQVVGTFPAAWEEVAVPPNAIVALPLTDTAPQGPVLVTADGPVVVGLVSAAAEGPTAFWSTTASSARELSGPSEAVQAVRDPSLSSRPATSATATPTTVPVPDGGGGEGQLDPLEPTATPVIVPEPTVTPTFSPGPLPTDVDPNPTPQPSATAPEADGPQPETLDPGTEGTEEGSLFG